MKENQSKVDGHSQSSGEKEQKPFAPGGEAGPGNSVNSKPGTSQRQQEWQEEISEGQREKKDAHKDSTQSLDEDDTIGIP